MRRIASGEHAFGAVAFMGVATALLYFVVVRAQERIAFSAPSLPAVALYVAATIGIFSLYIAVVRLAHGGLIRNDGARIAAFVVPMAIQAALVWAPPVLSVDLFSYLAHGKQVQLGKSPYGEPVKEIQHTTYGRELIERGWLPVHGISPYGPLWTLMETTVVRAATTVEVQVRLVKALAVGFSFVCAWLIWRLLGWVAPQRQMEGTLLYLWNPVVILEFAVEGHNDAIVLAGVLLALFFTVSARPGASLLALGSSALVKITSLVVLPPQAVLWWRRRSFSSLSGLAAAVVLLAAVTALLYAPFWIGLSTLQGVWGHGRPSVQPSTQGVLFWGLTRAYAPDSVSTLLSIVMTTVFAAFALGTSLGVTDERTALRACGWIAVAYLLLAPGYWPWYATLPIGLLALTPGGWPTVALVLLSFGSRLAAPIERLRLNGVMDWPTAVIVTTSLGLWLPAVALAVVRAATRRGRFASGLERVDSDVRRWNRIGERHGTRRVTS